MQRRTAQVPTWRWTWLPSRWAGCAEGAPAAACVYSNLQHASALHLPPLSPAAGLLGMAPWLLSQKEEASLPTAASNRDEGNFFESHPRPGLRGELLGDCRLDATVDGTDMWKVRSSGQAEGCGTVAGGLWQGAACRWLKLHTVYCLFGCRLLMPLPPA